MPSRPASATSRRFGCSACSATVQMPPPGFASPPRGGRIPSGIDRTTTKTTETTTDTSPLAAMRRSMGRPTTRTRGGGEIGSGALPTAVTDSLTGVTDLLTAVKNLPTAVSDAPTEVSDPATEVSDAATNVDGSPTTVKTSATTVKDPLTMVTDSMTEVNAVPTPRYGLLKRGRSAAGGDMGNSAGSRGRGALVLLGLPRPEDLSPHLAEVLGGVAVLADGGDHRVQRAARPRVPLLEHGFELHGHPSRKTSTTGASRTGSWSTRRSTHSRSRWKTCRPAPSM